MRIVNTKAIEEAIASAAAEACFNLTPACKTALEKALKEEKSDRAAFALETVIKNAETAVNKKMPVCQDTGMAVVYIKIGQNVFLEGEPLAKAVNAAVRKAYGENYFRKSVCDPVTRKNTGDNTPAVIHTEIVEGDNIDIAFLPKGFGSENMSRIYMLTPSKGVDGIIDAVVNTVKDAGSKPCPPVMVGVGIGGTFDVAAQLSKAALLRDVGTQSPRSDVAEIERKCLERINASGIGAQGFGGNTTALCVNAETAPTHIAGLPVAVNIQCHCVRCAKRRI